MDNTRNGCSTRESPESESEGNDSYEDNDDGEVSDSSQSTEEDNIIVNYVLCKIECLQAQLGIIGNERFLLRHQLLVFTHKYMIDPNYKYFHSSLSLIMSFIIENIELFDQNTLRNGHQITQLILECKTLMDPKNEVNLEQNLKQRTGNNRPILPEHKLKNQLNEIKLNVIKIVEGLTEQMKELEAFANNFNTYYLTFILVKENNTEKIHLELDMILTKFVGSCKKHFTYIQILMRNMMATGHKCSCFEHITLKMQMRKLQVNIQNSKLCVDLREQLEATQKKLKVSQKQLTKAKIQLIRKTNKCEELDKNYLQILDNFKEKLKMRDSEIEDVNKKLKQSELIEKEYKETILQTKDSRPKGAQETNKTTENNDSLEQDYIKKSNELLSELLGDNLTNNSGFEEKLKHIKEIKLKLENMQELEKKLGNLQEIKKQHLEQIGELQVKLEQMKLNEDRHELLEKEKQKGGILDATCQHKMKVALQLSGEKLDESHMQIKSVEAEKDRLMLEIGSLNSEIVKHTVRELEHNASLNVVYKTLTEVTQLISQQSITNMLRKQINSQDQISQMRLQEFQHKFTEMENQQVAMVNKFNEFFHKLQHEHGEIIKRYQLKFEEMQCKMDTTDSELDKTEKNRVIDHLRASHLMISHLNGVVCQLRNKIDDLKQSVENPIKAEVETQTVLSSTLNPVNKKSK